MKLRKLITKENILLAAILVLALALRIYQAKERFLYNHDNDLASWIVKDIVVNRHYRLIGQMTSTMGIFIGPLYYYYLVPFYLITKMDPIGGVYAITFLGLASILSFYFVFLRLFGKKAGLIASLVYAVSYAMVFNDREVVPTMPVVMWSVWYFYAINLFLKGKRGGYLLSGILIGLIWHLNMALILLLPLIPVSIYLSKKRVDWAEAGKGLIGTFLFSLPLILFELRHNFSQTKAFIVSLTTEQNAVFTLVERFQRVVTLTGKNLSSMIFANSVDFPTTLLVAIFLGLLIYLVYKKAIKKHLFYLMVVWLALYVAFFSIYSKVLSEYYLSGLAIIWITVLALSLARLKKGALLLLLLFLGLNLNAFFVSSVNRSGYVERKEIVRVIEEDRKEHNYPCISISYITSPGYDLGYRYFFYLAGTPLNKISDKVPVYTIIFPLGKDSVQEDRAIGAIGLIYPDYKRYPLETVKDNCSPENINVTGDMFGYTQ